MSLPNVAWFHVISLPRRKCQASIDGVFAPLAKTSSLWLLRGFLKSTSGRQGGLGGAGTTALDATCNVAMPWPSRPKAKRIGEAFGRKGDASYLRIACRSRLSRTSETTGQTPKPENLAPRPAPHRSRLGMPAARHLVSRLTRCNS